MSKRSIKALTSVSRQSGVTLIELMISITIGLAILAGVIQLYANSVQTQQSQEGFGRIQENIRYVTSRIEEGVSQAGYAGCFSSGEGGRVRYKIVQEVNDFDAFNISNNYIRGTNNDGLLGTDTLLIRSVNGGDSIPLTGALHAVVGDEAYRSTDPIVVDPNHPNYEGLQQYQVLALGDCQRVEVFMITNDPTSSNGVVEHAGGVVSPVGKLNEGQSNADGFFSKGYNREGHNPDSVTYLYTMLSQLYSINTSAAAAAAGQLCNVNEPQNCALFVQNGAGVAQELVEGVEDFQVEYGWQTAAGLLRFDDAAGVTDWSLIDRVRITLTMNSIEQAIGTEGDEFVTKTVSQVIMIRNQVSL